MDEETYRLKFPLPFHQAALFAILSGFLLIFAFPYTRLLGLAFVALVPLELALRGQGWLRGAILGFVGMVPFNGYLMWWSNFFGPPAFLALAAERTFVWFIFGGLLGRLRTNHPRIRLWSFAAGWTFCEYLRIYGPLGCTWGNLSHALAPYPIWIQANSLFGPWTLSFAIAFCNAWLAQLVVLRRRWPILKPDAIAGVSFFALIFIFGAVRLSTIPAAAESLKVGIVQPNMERGVRWDPRFSEMSLAKLETGTLLASQEGARLVVWPETAVPYRDFLRNPNLTMRIGMLARTCSSYIVVGSIEMEHDAANHTYNSASLVTPDGAFEGRYDKQRLVAGGEYLPFENWLRPFSIFNRVMRFLPGKLDGIFTMKEPKRPIKLGLLICFESMVPYLPLRRTEKGADILVVPTNDGWFGENSALVHHFEMAMMRAVESGRPVVQSGNTGISGAVDAYGRLLARTLPNHEERLVFDLPLHSPRTLYAILGDFFPVLMGVLWIFLMGKGSPDLRTETRSRALE